MVFVPATLLGVRRYRCYLPGKTKYGQEKERLKLEDAEYHPFVCASMEDFVHVTNKKVPLALLPCQDEKVLETDKTFYLPTPSYLGLKPHEFIPFYWRLPVHQRTLASILYKDKPCHLAFDLDWSVKERGQYSVPFKSAEDIARIQEAFHVVFHDTFKQTFGRAPRVLSKDHHWENNCNGDKLSLHVHILSEAFHTPAHFERWTKQVLIPYIYKNRESNLYCECLGAIVTKMGHKDFGKWQCLVDPSVASGNHLLRLGGNQKPGKTPLTWIPNVTGLSKTEGQQQTPLSIDELLFRGLMSYAITAPSDKWITYPTTSSSPSSLFKSSSSSPSVITETKQLSTLPQSGSVGNGSVGNGSVGNGNVAEYEWMTKVEIPWFTEKGLPQPEAVQLSVFQNCTTGVPCVRYKQKETVCPTCSDKAGSYVRHASNHSYLFLDARRQQFVLRSLDADCSKTPYCFPIPYTLAMQIPDPEFQRVYQAGITIPCDVTKGETLETSGCPRVVIRLSATRLPATAESLPASRKRPRDTAAGYVSGLSQCQAWLDEMERDRKRSRISRISATAEILQRTSTSYLQ